MYRLSTIPGHSDQLRHLKEYFDLYGNMFIHFIAKRYISRLIPHMKLQAWKIGNRFYVLNFFLADHSNILELLLCGFQAAKGVTGTFLPVKVQPVVFKVLFLLWIKIKQDITFSFSGGGRQSLLPLDKTNLCKAKITSCWGYSVEVTDMRVV